MPAATRPTSVTVVAWILIGLGAFGLLGTWNSYRMVASGEFDRMINSDPRMAAMLKDVPRPTTTQVLFGGVQILLQIVAGVMILKGNGLGRYLYVAMTLAGAAYALVIGNPILWMIPGLVITAIVAFFLFRPAANAYFSGAEAPVT